MESTPLSAELREALSDEGFELDHVRAMAVRPDGSEARGAFAEAAEMVKSLLVFVTNQVDPDDAQAILRASFAVLQRRRDSEEDDYEFVSVYGGDGKSVLLNVKVPATRPTSL